MGRFILLAWERSAECVGFIGGGTLQTKGKEASSRASGSGLGDSLIARCLGLLAILYNVTYIIFLALACGSALREPQRPNRAGAQGIG